MTKLKQLEARIEAIAEAHRFSAARCEGIIMCCRVIFPLIKIDSAVKQRMMTIAYDALSAHMDKLNFDDDFAATAREAIDEVFSSV